MRGRRQANNSGGPAQSSGRTNSNKSGSSDAVLLAADRVLKKESDYRNGVNRIQVTALLLAERISIKGEVEATLLQTNSSSDNGEQNAEAQDFLKEQRERLKSLCDGNAGRMKGIDDFLRAVADVRENVLQEEEEGDDGAPPPDYERFILEKIETIRDQRENGHYDDENILQRDEEFGAEVRKRLGEKITQKKRKRGSRANEEDDDDDLEILPDSSTVSLKCPVTGVFFENPLKNKVCGHTYSSAGLDQLIRMRKRNCPIPGCANNQLSREQVEEDVEMEIKVKRYVRRMEQERMTQKEEDEEEDVGGGIGNGMTVIE
uniref:SP-RING-type domain-containing protein n=1 Tax=Ditylum brightwellii TaxID=49249 RepID=A0A7S2EUI2_9STRA|mmetsp:Transcript_6436/g.9764  ORF Transcript_6436/g.9764 Transcript_6436/m.9764 type:complete len:318 (+) Transcript_6436:36-989(+)